MLAFELVAKVRTRGAIGIFYPVRFTLKAESVEEAWMKLPLLATRYEFLTPVSHRQINPEPNLIRNRG
jgi:hypothetical protein